MANPFLSSEEYDEQAHQLYNEGHYDEALEVLREGLTLYPQSVELHVGVGYARLAREEYAWARRSFERALVLDAEHEDALAGLAETLLRFGHRDAALRVLQQLLDLGYQDDLELMLQVARALFREDLPEEARRFVEVVLEQVPDSAEAVALLGYVQHRLNEDAAAITTLQHALRLDDEHVEARIYLANLLYDRGDYEAALQHLDRTAPEEHWDELGIWRLLELKKSIYRLRDDDAELRPWEARLAELGQELDPIDEMLGEIEQRFNEDVLNGARGQLELFGALLADLAQPPEGEPKGGAGLATHSVQVADSRFEGSWAEIVRKMRDAHGGYRGHSVAAYMSAEAQLAYERSGAHIPTSDPESFIRASAAAGLLRIVR